MSADNTVNLLLIHDNVDEANKLVSLLRNASFRVEPHYAQEAAELSKKLQERNWELAMVEFNAQSIPPKTVLHQIRRMNKDVPVILLVPEYDANLLVEGLRMGAADVAPLDQDQQIIQFVTRALNNLEQRRSLRYWKRRMAESESRFENLMLSSQDGIAVIQEGTYVHVNDTYAHFFGYLDKEALNLMPVFDSITRASQEQFKKYLKPLDEENALETESLQFEGVHADGSSFLIRASISQIDFHGEQALQVLVKKEFLLNLESFQTSGSSDQPTEADPAKVRLRDMIDIINLAIRKASRSGEGSLLCYLKVANFGALQEQLGLSATESVIGQLSVFIANYAGGQASFGRIREDSYICLLDGSDRDAGLAFAQALNNAVSSQTFETDFGSFSCSLAIGITTINEAATTADACLEQCIQAISEQARGKDKDDRGNIRFYETPLDFNADTLSAAEIMVIGKKLLNEDLLHLSYQPIIALHGDRSEFYEALVRIQSENLDEDIPADFIRSVFKTEIGRELDKKIIQMSLAALEEKLKTAPDTRLFINLSAATLSDTGFPNWLKELLGKHSLVSDKLIFQLREIDAGKNLARAAILVDNLKQSGVKTALNHYGLAINPATIFSKLHTEFVKFDPLLVENAHKGADGTAAITALIRELKTQPHKIIVPFIESPALIPALWQAGADYLQGNYVKSPGPEMDFIFEHDE